ncbi:hypothetical protein [Geothrix sp. 21YS21S-2]|uniref:hypothetical protein n=1 Tax=Geothrix sp. 21YS21S-2 TaxID=3068893 RepID=UPI0027B9B202|nr:hypothetical protein [Geothrix sp. 21YS21S-2]
MFNDNYPDAGYPYDFDEAATEDTFDARVTFVIQENASWLQSAPRTTQEIAAHLFPMEISPEGPDIDLLLTIASTMWDQGYTGGARDEDGNEWQWLEVKSA